MTSVGCGKRTDRRHPTTLPNLPQQHRQKETHVQSMRAREHDVGAKPHPSGSVRTWQNNLPARNTMTSRNQRPRENIERGIRSITDEPIADERDSDQGEADITRRSWDTERIGDDRERNVEDVEHDTADELYDPTEERE